MVNNVSDRFGGGGCSKFDSFVNIPLKLKPKVPDNNDSYCHFDALMGNELLYSSFKDLFVVLKKRKKRCIRFVTYGIRRRCR